MTGAIYIAICLGVYFIPTFVAHNRERQGAIFVLNLFLGWTILGWIGALIWAMVEKKKVGVAKPPSPHFS
jgi:hypothetical protein